MERVYLLLRNNCQSGPFTIGELLQQHITPSDMVWVEGKSSAWTYISELELTPFVKKIETADQPRDVKIPDEIERKAEQLRQRIMATAPKNHFQNHLVEIETYASPGRVDDEIQFVDYRKEEKLKKSTAFAELALTGLMVGVLVIGIYKSKSFFGASHEVGNSVATELTTNDQHTAQKRSEPRQVVVVPIVDTTKKVDSLLVVQRARQNFLANKKAVADSAKIVRRRAANQQLKNDEATIQKLLVPNDTVNSDENTAIKKEIIGSVPEIKPATEPVKEKKGFLKGLFKKKKDKE